MDVIIYKQDNGNVAVIVPTPEALAQHTIRDIAIKDVPRGTPFKIIDSSELPSKPQETWGFDGETINVDLSRLSPPPPPRLSMARFRLALHRLGHLAQVEAFMASPVTVEQKILWEYSTEVSRDDPTLAALAEALGFTEAQIDEVFKL